MNETASTSITRITEVGAVTEILELTQKEFDQIASKYGNQKRIEKKSIPYTERLARAKAMTQQDEELKEENFNGVDTGGFQNAVVLFKHWAEMTQQAIFEKKNFRIEINYNAEAMKTDFCIYTPIEDGQADIHQEHLKNQCQSFHQRRKQQTESLDSSEHR